ncbi:MAG: histidine phosphatase family protein [Mariprofundaceae bacterium]|nr:histidine phosphatase family protein [Mariprofundaceae bacterium]
MRTLILTRHAEANWGQAGMADFDRPLNAQGLQDAALMSDQLASSDVNVQKIMSSTAKRAHSTTSYFAKALGISTEQINYQKDLYLASPTMLLKKISLCSDQISQLMVVSHNPGLSELIEILTHRYMHDLPACAVMAIRFDLEHWADIVTGQGEVIYDEYPKKTHR